MNNNKKAFSLIIVMWIVLVTSLLAFTLFELIFPFSKSVIWVENSSKAYYLANSWLEDWLYKLKNNENINNLNFSLEKNNLNNLNNFNSSRAWVKVELVNKSKIEPIEWKWNSGFNSDYNKISVWEPIQIDLKWLDNLDTLKISFRVPIIDNISINPPELFWDNSLSYISWQLLSDVEFYSSNEQTSITKANINDSRWINVSDLKNNISNIWNKFKEFWCGAKKCILKFSILNELKTKKWVLLPYLEWKISNWLWKDFRLRYANIFSEWKESGYLRKLDIKIPQTTVNEAFDFAVFQ